MSAVQSAAENIVDTAKDTVKEVGVFIEDTGQAVVDDVVKPVATSVEKTVEAALDDPVNTAIRVGATVVAGPAGLAVANGAISLAQGNSIEDATLTAGKSYALATAGQMAGAEMGSLATDYGVDPETAKLIQGSTSGATKAGLSGGDVASGAVTGTLNAATGEAAKSISDQNFEDWAKEQAATSYENAPSPTEQDVLAAMGETPTESPLSTVTADAVPTETPLSTVTADTTPPEAYDPALTTGEIKAGLNFAKNAILNPASTTPLGSTAPKPVDYSGLAPLTAAPALAFAAPQFLDTSSQYLGGKSSSTTEANQAPHLQELKQLYADMTPELADVMAERVGTPQATQDPTMTTTRLMADGGSTDLATSLNPTEKNLGFVKPYAANMLPAAPLMSNQMKLNPLKLLRDSLVARHSASGLAHGGLPQKYAEAMPKGHKPEFITGLTGYYASGKGTGQSDDIDAMLHDGDYVADADLVAALGDGSSKAGAEALEKFRRQIPHQEHAVGGAAVPAKIADGEYVFPASFVTAIGQGDNKAGAKILDKMREAIRAHKRSAPTTKIPPKAKSPLDYLKMVKG